MTNKLLRRYAVDVFFCSVILILLLSMSCGFSFIDIIYFCCVVYYYGKIRFYRWKKCQ